MPENDAPATEPESPDRLDEFPLSQTEDFTTNDSRRAGPLGEAQDGHDQEDRVGLEERDDGDQKHQAWKGDITISTKRINTISTHPPK